MLIDHQKNNEADIYISASLSLIYSPLLKKINIGHLVVILGDPGLPQ